VLTELEPTVSTGLEPFDGRPVLMVPGDAEDRDPVLRADAVQLVLEGRARPVAGPRSDPQVSNVQDLGDAELAGSVPPYWPAALPKEEIEAAYQRDVNKAKQLLTAANASDLTFDLSFASYQDNPDRAAIIQSNLADAGITVNLKSADVGTWLDALLKNDYVSTTYTQLRYGNDWMAVNWQHSCGWTHSEANYTGVDDPEVDALIDQINGTIDDQERTKLEQDMQRKVLARHGPMFTLYQPYDYWAAYDYVKGYTPTSNGFGLYKYDYWIDKG